MINLNLIKNIGSLLSKRGNSLAFIGLLFISFSLSAAVEDSYRMMESESILIKSDNDLQRALVANSSIASVQVVNNRELLISAEKAGSTELILWYRNNPNKSVRVQLRITPNQARQGEIIEALTELISDLDPEGGVKFELRPAWIEASSSIRRSIDQVGSQVDGDARKSSGPRQDRDILQSADTAGSLSVKPLAGNYLLILKGEVSNEARKKRIHSVVSAMGLSVVNMINVTGPNQIQLSVRVAEVSKGNPFRMGTTLGDKAGRYSIQDGGPMNNVLLNVHRASVAGSVTPHIGQNDAFQILVNPLKTNLFGILSILEENNLSRTLAKPELVVQAGETANFLVGGEVPIPVAQGNNNGTTVEYKEYGVSLRFSPIITESGQIQMTVEPEVSEADYARGKDVDGSVMPAIISRKVTSTVTLEPGQSFIIGGLIQNNIMSTVRKVPFLGDIPILGALFRSTSFDKDESELAILVSAKFVEPIKPGVETELPGERLELPATWEGALTSMLVKRLPKDADGEVERFYSIGLERPL